MGIDHGSSASSGGEQTGRGASPDARQLDALTEPITRTEVSGAWTKILGALAVFALLYLFLISISALGAGFKLYGKGFAKTLITTTSNPFIGLFIGILATAVIQSSSTVTSMVVAFVAAGTLTVENAVPIVMGSNIGTTVTSQLVALTHINRRGDFRRAFSAATLHDFFNIMTVSILLPLELSTHVLQRTAESLTTLLFGSASMSFQSPVKVITAPVVGVAQGWVSGLPGAAGATVLVLGAFLVLAVSLFYLTKVIKLLMIHKLEGFFNSTVGRSGLLGILMGLIITALVQSSSVTMSLMVPMAAAGAVSLRQLFPIACGANIGTTVTALLAAMVGNAAGLTIAITHTLFNLSGVLLFYPIPAVRNIPIRMATTMGELVRKSRKYAVGFLLGFFFGLPGVLILIYRLL